jgi:hypothetical protein
LGRGLQPARGGSACPAIDPVLDDGLLLGWLKIFEDRREERLDEGRTEAFSRLVVRLCSMSS